MMARIRSRMRGLGTDARGTSASLARLGNVAPVRALRNALMGVSRVSRMAIAGLTAMAPALGAITGAASVAGIARLATSWAEFGNRLGTTARSMGVAPARLARMQNAMRLAGGSAASATDAMQDLAQAQWKASHGLDPAAAGRFTALFRDSGTAIGGWRRLKPDELLDQVLRHLRAIPNPVARSAAAAEMFGGALDGLQPALQASNGEWEKYVRQAERAGLPTEKSIDAAKRLTNAITNATLSFEGLRNAIGEAAEPVLTPMLNATAQGLQQLARWLRNGGWDKFTSDVRAGWHEIDTVIQRLGGWKSAARDAAIAMGGLIGLRVVGGIAATGASIVSLIASLAALKAAGGGMCCCGGEGVSGGRTAKGAGETAATVREAKGGAAAGGRDWLKGGVTAEDSLLGGGAGVTAARSSAGRAARAGLGAWFEETGGGAVLRMGGRVLGPIGVLASMWPTPANENEGAIVDRYRRSGRIGMPADVKGMVRAAAKRHGIDPDAFQALIQTEDGWDGRISPTGAFGPAQLMPKTAKSLGLPTSPHAPGYSWEGNLDGGARYFRSMLDRFHGSYETAEAAYNEGPNGRGMDIMSMSGIPDYLTRESRDYINRIRAAENQIVLNMPETASGGNGSAPPAASDVHVIVTTKGQPGTTTQVRAGPGIRVSQRDQPSTAMGAASATGN